MKDRLAALVVALPALWVLGAFILVAASRLTYPMDLEWMEGGQLYHAVRLLQGLPLYGPPDAGFVPFPYPPLHAAVLATVGSVTGVTYGMGRAVSLVAFAVSCGVVADVALRLPGLTARRVTLAALATGAVAATFPASGGWLDLVRVDSLALALLLLAARLVALPPSPGRAAVTGLLLAAAILTKQTSAFPAAFLAGVALVRSRRTGLVTTLVALLVAGAAALTLDLASDGWFTFWVLENPARHGFREAWVARATERLGPHGALAFCALAGAVALGLRRLLSQDGLLWAGLLAASVPASLLPFAKSQGFDNNLIPLLVTSVPAALAIASDSLRSLPPASRHRLEWAAAGLLSVLVTSRAFSPLPYVPTGELRAKVTRLTDRLRQLEGGVVIPNHPMLAFLAGDEGEQVHDQGYEDALEGDVESLDLPGFLRRRGARYAVLAGSENPDVRGAIYQVYERIESLEPGVSTLTGFRSGPTELLRRRETPARRDVRILLDPRSGAAAFAGTGVVSVQGWGRPAEPRFSTWGPDPSGSATARVESSPFIIDRRRLEVSVGGGNGPGCRVELVVDGRAVRAASGVGSALLTPTQWGVDELVGQSARLRLVDEVAGPFGWVLLGRVEAWDP